MVIGLEELAPGEVSGCHAHAPRDFHAVIVDTFEPVLCPCWCEKTKTINRQDWRIAYQAPLGLE